MAVKLKLTLNGNALDIDSAEDALDEDSIALIKYWMDSVVSPNSATASKIRENAQRVDDATEKIAAVTSALDATAPATP